jgi:hypothetical protein
VSIAPRGLIAAGLALAVAAAAGIAAQIASPHDADADQVTTGVDGADVPLLSPPPFAPGAGNAARAAVAEAVAGLSAVAPTLPTPSFAPKGRPSAVRGGALPRTLAAASAVQFLYASASQTAASDGALANVTVAKPGLMAADYHSLAEVAAQSADGRQIVEVGWTVDRGVNGDDRPHLFVYHWVDGEDSCYNGCGWVQYSTSVVAGAALPNAAAKRFTIQHFSAAWWIGYDTEWVGYFPDSLWGGRFTRAGLSQWFGEVAATTSAPCTDMGNGKSASNASAASFSNIALVGGPAANIAIGASSPYYTVTSVSSSSFRFGGPGAC